MSTARRSPLAALHDRLAIGLALLVPLTAVPVASNRASLWLVWTALLAAIAVLTLLLTWRQEPDWRPRILTQRLPLFLALIMPAWALLQVVPFGRLMPLPAIWPSPVSVLPEVAASGVLRFAGYLLLAALVIEVASRRERVLRLGSILFAGLVGQAIFALVALQLLDDFSLWGTKTSYQGVATGTFINRNSLATFLGLGLILGMGLLAERAARDRIRSTRGVSALHLGYGGIFILTGMLFLFAALVATQSRLGLASTVVAMAVTLLILRYRAGTPLPRLTGESLLLVALLALPAALLGAGGVSDRLLFTAADGDSRLAIYRQTLTMIAERPLLGYGMDAFGAGFEAFRAPPLDAPVSYDLAHNSYLMLWAEFGLIAGSAPILALLFVGLRIARRLKDDAGFPGMAAAGLGALVLGGLHSLGDFSLEIPAVTYLFTAMLALALGRRSGTGASTQKGRQPKGRKRTPSIDLQAAEPRPAAAVPALHRPDTTP